MCVGGGGRRGGGRRGRGGGGCRVQGVWREGGVVDVTPAPPAGREGERRVGTAIQRHIGGEGWPENTHILATEYHPTPPTDYGREWGGPGPVHLCARLKVEDSDIR